MHKHNFEIRYIVTYKSIFILWYLCCWMVVRQQGKIQFRNSSIALQTRHVQKQCDKMEVLIMTRLIWLSMILEELCESAYDLVIGSRRDGWWKPCSSKGRTVWFQAVAWSEQIRNYLSGTLHFVSMFAFKHSRRKQLIHSFISSLCKNMQSSLRVQKCIM